MTKDLNKVPAFNHDDDVGDVEPLIGQTIVSADGSGGVITLRMGSGMVVDISSRPSIEYDCIPTLTIQAPAMPAHQVLVPGRDCESTHGAIREYARCLGYPYYAFAYESGGEQVVFGTESGHPTGFSVIGHSSSDGAIIIAWTAND